MSIFIEMNGEQVGGWVPAGPWSLNRGQRRWGRTFVYLMDDGVEYLRTTRFVDLP